MFEIKIIPNPPLGDLLLSAIEPVAVNERGLAVLRYHCLDPEGGHKVGVGGLWTGLEMRGLGEFQPAAINDKDIIVGEEGRGLARWVRGKTKRLPGLGGAYFFPRGRNPILNAAGKCCGYGKLVVSANDHGQRGICWDMEGSTRLDSPHRYPQGHVLQVSDIAIADTGAVLCRFLAQAPEGDPKPMEGAFLFMADGELIDLPLPEKVSELLLSRDGFVVLVGDPGQGLNGNMIQRLDGRRATVLPRVPGPPGAQTYSELCISRNGNVAGRFTPSEESGAFLYSVDPYPSIHEIPSKDSLFPRFVTSHRWVVGELRDWHGRSIFLYDGFTLHRLDDLFPAQNGLRLSTVDAVSDRGHVLGMATVDGYSQPYLLVPTRLPA
jgi:hypothetical protein